MSRRFETERLIVRLFEPEDLSDIQEQVYADPDVCRYYCGSTRTLEETREWLAFRITEAKYSDFHAWAVEHKSEGMVIGLVRLGPYANSWVRFPEQPEPKFNDVEVELSFAFGQTNWGQGYAAEACRPVIEYAFTELRIPRLLGGAYKGNERSARLHEKLSYRVTENVKDGGYAAILENEQ
jgi:RimJ/RimL family protein N-acetyltransferase